MIGRAKMCIRDRSQIDTGFETMGPTGNAVNQEIPEGKPYWWVNSALSRTRPRTMPSSSGTMTPSSSVNYTNMEMTLEKLRKMSPQERYDYSVKNPEDYKALYTNNDTGGNE